MADGEGVGAGGGRTNTGQRYQHGQPLQRNDDPL